MSSGVHRRVRGAVHRRVRGAVGAVAGLALALAGLGVAAGSASPAAAAGTCGTDASRTPNDLDGDGLADVIVGMPARSGSAGAVDIHYSAGGSAVLTPASFGLPAAAAGDRFGASVTTQDLDADGCFDLVVGAPGRSAGSGAVYVARSTGSGFTGGVVLASPQAGSAYGTSVAVTIHYDVAAGAELFAVAGGAPLLDVSGRADAGGVVVQRMGPTLAPVGSRVVLTQDSPDVGGVAEAGDRYGSVIASSWHTIVVGVPLEDVGSVKDAGQAGVLYRADQPGGTWRGTYVDQASTGVPGNPETGDHFGAAVSIESQSAVVVGVPGEDIGSVRDAGMVHILTGGDGTYTHRRSLDQNTPGVPGANEPGDRFGASVASGKSLFGGESVDLMVGAPGEDVGSVVDAGAVTALEWIRRCSGTYCAKGLTQGSGLPGSPTAGARVGQTIALLADANLDEATSHGLAIGAPGARSGAGAVFYKRGHTTSATFAVATCSGGTTTAYGAVLAVPGTR